MFLAYNSLILVLFLATSTTSQNTWNDPSSNQYHIQTDEGPERYFRYQTLSGQYRKEKRLEDGTVVGTYAWIDDDGILRQRDYVADNAGYRILKSKNVYVGRNVPVGDAVKAAKKVPPQAGTLVKSNSRPVPVRPVSNYLPTVTSTTSRPFVEISPNSFPSSTVTPLTGTTPSSIFSSTVTNPALLLLPPNRTYYSSSTTSGYDFQPTTYRPYTEQDIYNNVPAPVINQNSLDYNPYVNQQQDAVFFQNGPTYPINRRGETYHGQNLGNGYDPQYPQYDGVSVTNDGFRYYIPRAYHEEQNLPENKKAGSFGYIDPFGIRRVIYYNAAPGTGFQHRKNNRYVGFQATPYDPRPY